MDGLLNPDRTFVHVAGMMCGPTTSTSHGVLSDPDGSRASRSRTREGQDPSHDHTNWHALGNPR